MSARLAATGRAKLTEKQRTNALQGFVELIDELDPHDPSLASTHTLDALVAAYTGWLAPEGLEEPPEGFNVAAGWIWFPTAANENEPAPTGDSASTG